jgi:hypothetical protein
MTKPTLTIKDRGDGTVDLMRGDGTVVATTTMKHAKRVVRDYNGNPNAIDIRPGGKANVPIIVANIV